MVLGEAREKRGLVCHRTQRWKDPSIVRWWSQRIGVVSGVKWRELKGSENSTLVGKHWHNGRADRWARREARIKGRG